MIARTASRNVLVITEIFVGLSAVSGGTALALGILDPVMRLPPEWLHGTSFNSYLIPAVILVVVVGGSYLGGAALVILGSKHAAPLSVCAGLVLVVWMVTQICMIGLRMPALQITYLLLGFVTIGLAWREI